ncbi:bifunctional phosphoglucose/phosphomannose isomerase [Candidatus Saccharibacteria bacterium]|nr:bifunctional phosphoglucose/phosphomannose isomerase [Candidatus Saccharibacteria bacterium]
MLDDLKVIHERDTHDALGIVQKQCQQLVYAYSAALVHHADEKPIYNVVLAGMGGSALAALMVQSWPGVQVPFEVVRNYEIPGYVDADTLFIASSYSGNTEETLAALVAAEAKGARIVVVAAGGKLSEMAKAKNYPLFEIPAGLQPRMAVFYNFAALVQLLHDVGLVPVGSIKTLHQAASWLEGQLETWLPTVPSKKNYAKQIAQDLMGKSVVVYSGPALFPVAYKWKININENAKSVAWCNQYPEFNHNEMLGWTSHPVDKPYAVVDLRSNLDNARVQKRFEVASKLLSGKRPAALEVQITGESLLEQMLWAITLGDYVSVYLALLNGVDPTPVVLIEKFKKALNT